MKTVTGSKQKLLKENWDGQLHPKAFKREKAVAKLLKEKPTYGKLYFTPWPEIADISSLRAFYKVLTLE